MQYPFLTIEGNIGAGKTTLACMLAKHYNSKLILEEFADNPFLPRFYKEPDKYAFPLELFFMAERYKQLKEMMGGKDIFKDNVISDYMFTKSLLFAKITLADEEFRLYQRLFEIVNPQLVQPDLLVYLHVPIKKLQENIRKRNRSYEQEIQDDYLFRLQNTYMEYIKQHPIRSLIIDASSADFEHDPSQFNVIVDALERDYSVGQHYMALK